MKKHLILLCLLALSVTLLPATKYAGEIFSFSPGVKNQAMGNTGLTLADFTSSGWWNPALLAESKLNGIELRHSEMFEGLLSQNQITLRLDKASAININHLLIDKVKLTRLEDENSPISNDNRPYVWKSVSNQDIIITGSFARSINPRLALGLSPKLAYRRLAEHSGYGFGADFGAYLALGKGFALGANLRDFFGTQILWESGNHEIALPNLDLEVGYNRGLGKREMPLQIALRSRIIPDERGEASSLSSEALSADLHAGAMLQIIPQLALMAGWDVNSFSSGMGLKIQNWGLDYAIKGSGKDGLGISHNISANYQW